MDEETYTAGVVNACYQRIKAAMRQPEALRRAEIEDILHSFAHNMRPHVRETRAALTASMECEPVHIPVHTLAYGMAALPTAPAKSAQPTRPLPTS